MILGNTSCWGSLTGNSLSRTALTKLKIAVFAPIPSASVSTATAVNPGFLLSMRRPYRTSSTNSSTRRQPHVSRAPPFRALPRSHLQMALHFLFNLRFPLLPPPETHGPPLHFLTSLLPYFLASLLLFRLQHPRDRIGKLRPFRTFLAQLFLS